MTNEERKLADQLFLAMLEMRGWSSWVAPWKQEKECERLWREAKAIASARIRGEYYEGVDDESP